METGDEWLAPDKYEHLIACLLITLIATLACRLTRHPFLRRRSALLGSLAGLSAGAAKEAADEIGLLWPSAGASAKDAAADLLGVALALLLLALYHRLLPSLRRRDPDGSISMV